MDIEGANLKLTVKWGKKTLDIETSSNDTLETFKAQLYSLTSVLPEKQKLMYKGKFLKEESKTLKDSGINDVNLQEYNNDIDGSSRRQSL